MKKFIRLIILFFIPIILGYLVISLCLLPELIEKTSGPSTERQIKKSFQLAKNRSYDLLILGSSTNYRGINPDLMNIPSYNFSHDNDSYNQMYYKLKYLEDNHIKIKYLILGIEYFQFSYISDTRNYVYSELLGDLYNKDYENNFIDLFLKKTNLLEFQRLKYMENIFKDRQTFVFLKDNGQYILPGRATENDRYFYEIKRLQIQEKYFKAIIDDCSKNNIWVFLVMPPVRKNALDNYQPNQIKEFDKFIHSHTKNNVVYLNYANQDGWKTEDYTDITHFNEKAADKYSRQLNDTINQIINK
jgi:hypothetical protein